MVLGDHPLIVHNSTGHACLDIWLSYVWREIESRGLWDKVWACVDDFHDETVLECEEGVADQVAECLKIGLEKLNAYLNPDIPLSGGVEISDNFSQFKQPDPVPFYSEHLARKKQEADEAAQAAQAAEERKQAKLEKKKNAP